MVVDIETVVTGVVYPGVTRVMTLASGESVTLYSNLNGETPVAFRCSVLSVNAVIPLSLSIDASPRDKLKVLVAPLFQLDVIKVAGLK